MTFDPRGGGRSSLPASLDTPILFFSPCLFLIQDGGEGLLSRGLWHPLRASFPHSMRRS